MLLKTRSNLHRSCNFLDLFSVSAPCSTCACTMSGCLCWLFFRFYYYILEGIWLKFSSMVCSTSMVRKQQYVNTQIYVEVIWTSYRSYDLSHKSDRFLYEFLARVLHWHMFLLFNPSYNIISWIIFLCFCFLVPFHPEYAFVIT